MIDYFYEKDKVACFMSVRPNRSFHIVSTKANKNGLVKEIQGVIRADLWINGGFFILKKDIFNYMKKSEDIVNEPFKRLIRQEQLVTYKYDGFWVGMDTFKDKQTLDDMTARGDAPWEVWKARSEAPAQYVVSQPENLQHVVES